MRRKTGSKGRVAAGLPVERGARRCSFASALFCALREAGFELRACPTRDGIEPSARHTHPSETTGASLADCKTLD